MRSVLKLIVPLLCCVILAGCSTQTMRQNMSMLTGTKSEAQQPVSNGKVGGTMQDSMDEIDRGKMTHALESAPGKATHWENALTKISYTVTPVKKVVIGNNQFCREYTVTSEKNGVSSTFSGTACIGTDGNWQAA